jgi:hypothetical protein
MELRGVSTFFSTDWVDGWEGSRWVSRVARADLEAFEDVIRTAEDFLRIRLLSVPGGAEGVLPYSVIRVGGKVFLVGESVQDSYDPVSPYQTTFMLRVSDSLVTLLRPQETVAASGTVSSLTMVAQGQYHACVEYGSGVVDSTLPGNRTSVYSIKLPRDCPVKLDDEVLISPLTYTVNEVYMEGGLKVARVFRRTEG